MLIVRHHVRMFTVETSAARRCQEDYGDQRLWSAIGFGSMALVAGKLVDWGWRVRTKLVDQCPASNLI